MNELSLAEKRVIAKALSFYKRNMGINDSSSYQVTDDYHKCCDLLTSFLDDIHNNKEQS